MRGNKHLNRMEKLKLLKCCFSGTVVTIWEIYFLILNSHTQLTTSFISIVSYFKSAFMGAKKIKNDFGKIVLVFGDKAIEFGDF